MDCYVVGKPRKKGKTRVATKTRVFRFSVVKVKMKLIFMLLITNTFLKLRLW